MKKVTEDFLKRNNLLITKANKRGTILILDVKYHISKANKQV